MSFKNALASIAVRDIRTGIEWYQALLGKPPDSIPMSEVAEWVIMIQDPDGNSVALAEAFDSEMAQ
jgi:hypothetical protein